MFYKFRGVCQSMKRHANCRTGLHRFGFYRLTSMLIFAAVALAACGQKGDLYLPPVSSPQPETITPDNTTQEKTEPS